MTQVIDILSNRNYTFVEQQSSHILMNDEKDDHVLVFKLDDNITINMIKLYIKIMIDNNINHSILVYNGKITPSANKVIKNTNFEIELFTHNEMSINIFKHKYYYPHIKLDDTTKQLLLTKYGNKLPVILKTDPIVRYLNFKKGDILKIIRKHNYITYRIVK